MRTNVGTKAAFLSVHPSIPEAGILTDIWSMKLECMPSIGLGMIRVHKPVTQRRTRVHAWEAIKFLIVSLLAADAGMITSKGTKLCTVSSFVLTEMSKYSSKIASHSWLPFCRRSQVESWNWSKTPWHHDCPCMHASPAVEIGRMTSKANTHAGYIEHPFLQHCESAFF